MIDARSQLDTVSSLKTRLASLRLSISAVTERLQGTANKSTDLVRAVVRTASEAGMEMTRAAETVSQETARRINNAALPAHATSYEISLRGTYLTLVQFLRLVGSWQFVDRIEVLQILPSQHIETTGEVNVNIVMSVFSNKT